MCACVLFVVETGKKLGVSRTYRQVHVSYVLTHSWLSVISVRTSDLQSLSGMATTVPRTDWAGRMTSSQTISMSSGGPGVFPSHAKENMGLRYERRPTTPSRPLSSQQQQQKQRQWKQSEQLDMKLPPSSLPHSTGFDSLQDLLEREGYKETRIVTPKIPHMITIDDADDMGLVTEDKPTHARLSLKPLHESATNVNLQRSPEKRQDIERWVQGIMPSNQDSASKSQTKKSKTKPSKTSDTHVLRTSQSDHALKRRPLRRKSSIWDASVAYRQSSNTGADVPPVPKLPFGSSVYTDPPVPPVPTVPSQFKKKVPATEVSAATAAPSSQLAVDAAPALGFLSSPAKPVLSRKDAVVQVYDTDSTVLPRGLRRSKSEDLLHKALKSRRMQRADSLPVCNCGRDGTKVPIEPRWHTQVCPVRLRWEATMPEPVPPPPPQLFVSTPNGISAPKYLDLKGTEYDPLDTPSGFAQYFPFSRPGFHLAKRATLAGLHGLFKSHEQMSQDISALRRPVPTSQASQPLSIQRRSSKHRLSRCKSLPQLSPSSNKQAHVSDASLAPGDGEPVALTGSRRIHELHQHVQDRMKQDGSTSACESAFSTIQSYDVGTEASSATVNAGRIDVIDPDAEMSNKSPSASMSESPSLRRARSRTHLNRRINSTTHSCALPVLSDSSLTSEGPASKLPASSDIPNMHGPSSMPLGVNQQAPESLDESNHMSYVSPVTTTDSVNILNMQPQRLVRRPSKMRPPSENKRSDPSMHHALRSVAGSSTLSDKHRRPTHPVPSHTKNVFT